MTTTMTTMIGTGTKRTATRSEGDGIAMEQTTNAEHSQLRKTALQLVVIVGMSLRRNA